MIKPDAVQLEDHERQRCEVWSRVMGYHRPVAAWNTGKRQEHCDRVAFTERKAFAEDAPVAA